MREYNIENYNNWLKSNGFTPNYWNLMEFKDEMQKEEEHYNEVIQLYDELMQKQENRGISYGEIAHIQGLNSVSLGELYDEINKELGVLDNGNGQ